MKAVLLAAVFLLALPATAVAGVRMVSRDVPLAGARTLATAAPQRFDLLGVHWRGSGSVLYSTRSVEGRWGPWHAADADQYPDPGSAENRLPGWRLGAPAWVGPSTAARFRTRGNVTRLRAFYVQSTVERTAARRLTLAGAPSIIPRSAWHANEAIRKGTPQYADAVRFAVVHHTAGTNAYTPAQSAAIVRGIELYHVQANGWNDIGYNFLVDRYGQIFEGRYGGVDRAVVGAHAQGFNTGSVGVAVLGEYGRTRISGAARRALVELLAWRLDLAHVDPLSSLTWLSGGNPRFPARVPVPLRAISGHRDTGFTDCPGDALYAQLPGIARDVALTGAPKLYAPEVAGKLGGPIRFRATLSGETPWTVTVTDGNGTAVAVQSGTGPALDWTWDSSSAPPGRYAWSISGQSLRGAGGSLGTRPATALAFQGTAASPAVLAPGGEPADDAVTITYTLGVPATVTGTLVGPTGTVGTIFSGTVAAGPQRLVYVAPATLASGAYQVLLTAADASGATASAAAAFVVDPTVQAFTAPAVVSFARPGGLPVAFSLSAGPVEARLDVLRGETVVATPAEATYQAGDQTLGWDGTLADGTRAPDGVYTVRLTVTDAVATVVRSAPLAVDSTPPALTVVSVRGMRFRLSERATVTLVVGSRRYTSTHGPGPLHFWLKRRPNAYRVVVTDAAGNSSGRLYRTR